jgi:hypothetical protein
MNNFVDPPSTVGLVKLSGRITRYHHRRELASFVLTPGDQTTMDIIAIGAAVAGLSGQAISVAGNTTCMEEEADYVQFMINHQCVKGWVWRSPFKEGDIVEVVAVSQKDHYEAFGIARPHDRAIALYPHCSRGRASHIKNAIKWWLWLVFLGQSIFLTGLLLYIMGPAVFGEGVFYAGLGGSCAFYALMFASLARNWMPYVSLAEKVFKTLGWANPSNVDLVKSSKAQRLDGDPGEFGTFYFRY